MDLITFSRLLLDESESDDLWHRLSVCASRAPEGYAELWDVLKRIAPIYSKSDYTAFLREGSRIPDDLFILGYLAEYGICLETGAFDEEWFSAAAAWTAERTGLPPQKLAALGGEAPDEEAFLVAMRREVEQVGFSLLWFASDVFFEQYFIFVLPDILLHGKSIDSAFRVG